MHSRAPSVAPDTETESKKSSHRGTNSELRAREGDDEMQLRHLVDASIVQEPRHHSAVPSPYGGRHTSALMAVAECVRNLRVLAGPVPLASWRCLQ